MERRRRIVWSVAIFAVTAGFITMLHFREAVRPDPFASLQQYVTEERGYVAAPFPRGLLPTTASPRITTSRHYGTRWRIRTLRGITREDLINTINGHREQEGGWSEIGNWHTHFAIHQGSFLDIDSTPTIQVWVRHGGSGKTGGWDKNTDVQLSESRPLSVYDYWLRRIAYMGKKIYDAP